MKKALFILSLVFATGVTVSANTAISNSAIQNSILEHSESGPGVTESFNIELGDGYTLSGVSITFEYGIYSYSGVLTLNGIVVGSASGSFQNNSNDSYSASAVALIVDDSFLDESYSNDETAAVVKAKHNAVKNAIANVR